MSQSLIYQSELSVSAQEAFEWHAREGAIERLNPPFDPVEVVSKQGGIEVGGEVTLKVGPLKQVWQARHIDYHAGRSFTDIQVKGPFASWEHTHRMEPQSPSRCILSDEIEYQLPLAPVGETLGKTWVESKMDQLFAYRHRLTHDDLLAHSRWSKNPALKVLITGASGMIGSALVPYLQTGGHEVHCLRRHKKAVAPLAWNPADGILDPQVLEGFDAVIHLSGENINGRWTEAKKRAIRDSRVKSTRLLSEALAQLKRPPKVLVAASAIGFYGNQGKEILTEASPPGEGFLAEVAQEWEEAAMPAQTAGIRMVNLRIGVVLSPLGGALQKMLPPFKMGLGGRLGSGQQYLSWIAIDDLLDIFLQALQDESLSGPLNGVAPQPITNEAFTRLLGRELSRPTFLAMPETMVKGIFGEMGEETVLASVRSIPEKLNERGFSFRFEALDSALAYLLGNNKKTSGILQHLAS